MAIEMGIAAILPSIGSLLLISSERLEDRLFVQALVSPELSRFSPLLGRSTIEFVGQTGFLWALLFAIVTVLWVLSNGFPYIMIVGLPKEEQLRRFDQLSAAQRFSLGLVAASFDQDVSFKEEDPYGSVAEAVGSGAIFTPIKHFFPLCISAIRRIFGFVQTHVGPDWA